MIASTAMRSLAFVVCLGLAGCGSSTKPPVAGRPAPVGKRAPSTAIVFVVAYEALLPVACFDAVKLAWATGSACLSLLPIDTPIRLEHDSKVVKSTGRRVPTVTGCTLATELVMFDGADAEKPGALGVWPASSTAQFRRIAWDATQKGSVDLKPNERGALARGMAKVGRIEDGVALVQTASADLDDDGTSELILSANTAGFDPSKKNGFGALLVGFASQPEMAVVRSSDHTVFRAEGSIDLNDDGLAELLISERTSHPNGQRSDSYTFARFEGGSVAPLPPVESCWPPLKTH